MNRALAFAATLSLFACHNIDGGPDLSETRSLEPFTRVRIEGGLTATLTPGSPQATVNAPQKVVENLQTVVLNGTLIVRLKPGVIVTSLESTEVLITGQAVAAVEATGASQLTVSGVDASPFRASASGASQLTVSGKTADARLSASGASTVSAAELIAEVARVDASGASTIQVSASKSVEGSASGASQVTVSGGADAANVSTSGGSSAAN
jgi:hypothetical protein